MLPSLAAKLTRNVEAGRSSFKVDIVRVPDPAQIWTIRGSPVLTSDFDLTLSLDDEGVLTSTQAVATDRTVATLAAVGTVVGAVLPFLDVGPGEFERALEAGVQRCKPEARLSIRQQIIDAKKVLRDRPEFVALFYPGITVDDFLKRVIFVQNQAERECFASVLEAHSDGTAASGGLTAFLRGVLGENINQRAAREVLRRKQELDFALLKERLGEPVPVNPAQLRLQLSRSIGREDLVKRIDKIEQELERFPRAASGSASAYGAYRDARLELVALSEEFDAEVGQALAPLKVPGPEAFAGREVPIVAKECIEDGKLLLGEDGCPSRLKNPKFIVVLEPAS
jgi:hypothetical protein